MVRVWVVLLGAAVFLISAALLQQLRPMVQQIANGMLGENWYRIQLNTDHVGYMYNHTFVDAQGQWHFQSTTHFQLQSNAPNTISKHLIFDARPPYQLVEAVYRNRGESQTFTTTVTQTENGMQAKLERGDSKNELALDWQYGLEDFLSFESWLASTAPSEGEQYTTSSPDFERLRIISRAYRVVAQNDEGHLVETNALLAATQTQLDHNYRPVNLNMAGIFDVYRSSEADAIALRTLKRKSNYLFPVDQRLYDHTEVARLHLRLNGAQQFDLPKELKLRNNPVVSRGNGAQYRGEELNYPITHPKIQALVQQSLTEPSADNPVPALVNTAHEQLRYAEDRPAGSVLTALAEGQGECTDYADLFTTLARAAGLPARNIYGLAYKDGAEPAFTFHAWNEVFSNGRWQAVDPTWNQTVVDATHIPLSEAQAALMMLANNTGQVSFSVMGFDYL